jgi:cytochrome P450
MHSYASRSWLALSFDEDQAAFEAQRFSSDIRDNCSNNANSPLIDYFIWIIADTRQAPSQDLIDQLIAAEEELDSITAGATHLTCVLLLLAGHEMTTRPIGNGMLYCSTRINLRRCRRPRVRRLMRWEKSYGMIHS